MAAPCLRPTPAIACQATNGSYPGPKQRGTLKGMGDWRIEIIKRFDAAKGFVVLLRRWVAERPDPWVGQCRHLAKTWASFASVAEALLLIAHIHFSIRRLARWGQPAGK